MKNSDYVKWYLVIALSILTFTTLSPRLNHAIDSAMLRISYRNRPEPESHSYKDFIQKRQP